MNQSYSDKENMTPCEKDRSELEDELNLS